MHKNSGRYFFLALLFLVCAFCCQIHSFFRTNPLETENSLSLFVPERLRGFIAGRLWEQADRYMHAGPSKNLPEGFVAGSYAGNTDLLPLIRMVTMLVPHELPPWKLLADNLGRHLGKRDKAIRVLQEAIHENLGNPEIHELYASIAALKMFTGKPDENDKISALKYLKRAIKTVPEAGNHEKEQTPGFGLDSYYVLCSRLYVELLKPDLALAAWIKSGISLHESQGKLPAMLIDFRDKGVAPDPSMFQAEIDLPEQTSQKNLNAQKERIAPIARRSRFSVVLVMILFLLPFLVKLALRISYSC